MSLHPLTQFTRLAVKVFTDLGFEIVEGPEMETVGYNFDKLRIPKNHPARNGWDTFYLNDSLDKLSEEKLLLRCHTSPMQIRSMKNRKPPVKFIIPGRCFRNERTDASHETNFYQLEGLVIDKNVNMAQLLAILDHFIKTIFGKDIKTRARPDFFPFVEPGMDMAMYWKNKWLEILGAGMVHPGVLKNMGVNSKKYTGFAFGMGLDRLMMLYYGVNDMRLSYTSDFRFLKQF